MKIRLNLLVLVCSIFLVFGQQVNANEPVSTSYWGNVALGGHDVVAYYQEDAKQTRLVAKGNDAYSVEWQGVSWQFASQASADKFAKDPSQYVPRYNGYCANALSLGEGLITTSGKVWEFFGDELHLFYAERGRQRWLNGDWKYYQTLADQAWEKEL